MTGLACAGPAPDSPEERLGALIYGDDDRRDLYAVDSELVRTAALQSTVAAIPERALIRNPDGTFGIDGRPLGEVDNLCASEPFWTQPSVAHCSGVLIDDRLVLTAGHCASPDTGCDDRLWVFHYALLGQGGTLSLTEEDIYRCRSVRSRRRGTDRSGRRWDHAVVELDRAVARPRHPVAVADAPVSAGDLVTLIGYPSGLPVKVEQGVPVIDGRAGTLDYFTLRSDTFDGSSGSGVFDRAGRLTGIIVRGGVDYVYQPAADCFTVRRVPAAGYAGSSGEQASHVGSAVACLCATGWQSPALCSGAPAPCPAIEETAAGCAFGGSGRPLCRPAPGFLVVVAWLLGARRRRPPANRRAVPARPCPLNPGQRNPVLPPTAIAWTRNAVEPAGLAAPDDADVYDLRSVG